MIIFLSIWVLIRTISHERWVVKNSANQKKSNLFLESSWTVVVDNCDLTEKFVLINNLHFCVNFQNLSSHRLLAKIWDSVPKLEKVKTFSCYLGGTLIMFYYTTIVSNKKLGTFLQWIKWSSELMESFINFI